MMDEASGNPVLVSKELSDLNAFFTAFEKMKKELLERDIPAVISEAAKDELGWYAVIRIRPSSKY
jgi:hypothetical protein